MNITEKMKKRITELEMENEILNKLKDEKDIIYFERWEQSEFFLTKYRESSIISNSYVIKRYERFVSSIANFIEIEEGIKKKVFHPHKSSESIALYMVSFLMD